MINNQHAKNRTEPQNVLRKLQRGSHYSHLREIVGHEQLEVPVMTRQSALTGILHIPKSISTFLILIEKIKDYYLLSTKVNQDREISSLHRKTLAE